MLKERIRTGMTGIIYPALDSLKNKFDVQLKRIIINRLADDGGLSFLPSKLLLPSSHT